MEEVIILKQHSTDKTHTTAYRGLSRACTVAGSMNQLVMHSVNTEDRKDLWYPVTTKGVVLRDEHSKRIVIVEGEGRLDYER